MKTKEEIIAERKRFPRVFVSDNGVTWVRRILLFEHIDGFCFAVNDRYERAFLSGYDFNVELFRYYKPLPEKKYVPFEHGKEIDFDWVFRSKKANYLLDIHSISSCGIYAKNNMTYYNFNYLASKFELSKDGGQTWGYAGKEVEE